MGQPMPAEQHILHRILATVDRLAPVPRLARRAFELAADEDIDITELAAVIQYDPVITSKCLQLCNSSYFWIKEEVTSLRRAVVILGTRNIVKIVLAHCMKTPEFTGGHKGYGLGKGDLWRHSVCCAVLSGLLAEAAGLVDDTTLFTAALLHDVGKLVLNPFAEEKAPEMEEMLAAGHALIETEKEVLEIDHAELGGMIAAGWKFPDVLTNAIRGHHRPLGNDLKPGIPAWVRLTDLTAYLYKFNTACHHGGEIECGIKPSILARFGLDADDISKVYQACRVEMQKLNTFL
jgi:putative nucleotidyltransferase with HDIG domain